MTSVRGAEDVRTFAIRPVRGMVVTDEGECGYEQISRISLSAT